MKKLFNISLAALAAMVVGLSACNKTVVVDDEVVGKDNGLILVNLFDADSPATRSTVALSSYEKVIRSAQVFVFSDGQNTTLGLADGQLETDKYVSLTSAADGTTPITLTTSIGPKRIWAVVNAPRLTGITKEADLMAKTSALSENVLDASNGKLVMAGAYGYTNSNKAIEIAPQPVTVTKYAVGTPAQTVEIPVYRLGASIELKNVTVNFTDTDLNGKTFQLKEIYLKNVVNCVAFDGTASGAAALATQSNWSSQIGRGGVNWKTMGASTDISSLLWYEYSSPMTCATNGTSTEVNQRFYVYPNGQTADSNSSSWAARRTRLVLYALIDGVDSFYPFSIADPASYAESLDDAQKFPSIVGNRKYIINNINITMKGKPNDNDDSVPEAGKIEAKITVTNWAGETILEYNI